MSKHLSIIIPAYNEEHRIKETLEAVFNYFLRQIIPGKQLWFLMVLIKPLSGFRVYQQQTRI